MFQQIILSDEQELVNAIKTNAIVSVKILITPNTLSKKPRVDLNIFRYNRDDRGYTALHLAIENYKLGLDKPGESIIECILSLYPNLINQCANGPLNLTPLQFAAIFGFADPIPLLMAKGAGLDFTGTNGFTPLILASFNNRLNVVHKLIVLGARHDIVDQNNNTALFYAIQHQYWPIVEFFLTTFVNLRLSTCKLAIEQDEVQLFRALLRSGYIPKQEELADAKTRIKQLLEYKPGRRQKNQVKYPNIGNYSVSKDRNQKTLTRMIYDQENTSDEESSDSEDEGFQFLETTESKKHEQILYRGAHFNPRFFNTKHRKLATKKAYHHQPVYSQATSELGKFIFDYEHADQLVRSYFELLKLTPNRREHDSEGKLKQKKKGEDDFQSLYYHFIQAYVNSYDALFKNGEMTQNYNFYSNNNPIVSTIPRLENTIKYATGEAIDQQSKYSPKLRQSTGTFKHRCLGYIHVYRIEQDYLEKFSVTIGDLKQQGKINLAARRESDEVLFESSIPARYILGYQILSLPSFNKEWTPKIKDYYGLEQFKYNEIKNSLLQNSENPSGILKTWIPYLAKTQGDNILKSILAKSTKTTVINSFPVKNPLFPFSPQPIIQNTKKSELEIIPFENLVNKPTFLIDTQTKLSNHETLEQKKVRTIGDGNCAFNAVALVLSDLVLAGGLENHPDLYNMLKNQIPLAEPSAAAFKEWLKMKSNDNRQKILQSILRQLAIDYIEKNYVEIYKNVYETLLWDAYENQKNPDFFDDTFIVHEHVEIVFKKNFSQDELLKWWEDKGKKTYFDNIRQSARGAYDKKRWGGEPEIDALAVFLGINIWWEKGRGNRNLGIGSGIIKDLTSSESNILIQLNLAEKIGHWTRLNLFSDQDSLITAMSSLSEPVKKALFEYLDTIEETQLALPDFLGNVPVDNQLKTLLFKKKIINEHGRFINDQSKIERNRIKQIVAGIIDVEFRNKILQAFKPAILFFGINHQGEHWTYVKSTEIKIEGLPFEKLTLNEQKVSNVPQLIIGEVKSDLQQSPSIDFSEFKVSTTHIAKQFVAAQKKFVDSATTQQKKIDFSNVPLVQELSNTILFSKQKLKTSSTVLQRIVENFPQLSCPDYDWQDIESWFSSYVNKNDIVESYDTIHGADAFNAHYCCAYNCRKGRLSDVIDNSVDDLLSHIYFCITNYVKIVNQSKLPYNVPKV